MEAMEKSYLEIDDTQVFPYIVFRLQDVRYAISSEHVLAIKVLEGLFPIIGLDANCRGAVMFRGKCISVYDLRRMFGLPDAAAQADHGEQTLRDMLILLQIDTQTVGIIVDEVCGIQTLCSINAADEKDAGAQGSEYISFIAADSTQENGIIEVFNPFSLRNSA